MPQWPEKFKNGVSKGLQRLAAPGELGVCLIAAARDEVVHAAIVKAKTALKFYELNGIQILGETLEMVHP